MQFKVHYSHVVYLQIPSFFSLFGVECHSGFVPEGPFITSVDIEKNGTHSVADTEAQYELTLKYECHS